MKKHKNKTPNHPCEAIVTPVAHSPKSRVTIPGEENVIRAKQYVEENQK